MQIRNMMRIGYLIIFAGAFIASLLMLQAKDCPTFSCSVSFVYFAATALFVTILSFMLTSIFVMRLLIQRFTIPALIKIPSKAKVKRKTVKSSKRKHFK